MEKVIVSAITGGVDYIKEQPSGKYILFTDGEPKSKTWEVRKAYDRFKDPRMNAKIHKVLLHQFVKADYSLWIDGTLTLKVEPEVLFKKLKKDIAFISVKLNGNKPLDVLKQAKRKDDGLIDKQLEKYKDFKYPYVAWGGCIIRKHTEECNQLCEKWWSEICTGTTRDQISLPYVFRDKAQIIEDNWQEYFKFTHHERCN